MKVQIRPSALEDLTRGYRFYDMHDLGVGAYFFDSLALYAGIHPKIFGYSHEDFLTRYTMKS